MRTVIQYLVSAVLAVSLASPALGQARAVRSDLIGCYALYYQRGRVDSSLRNATPSVRLDSTLWRVSGSIPDPTVRVMTRLTLAGRPAPMRPRKIPFQHIWSADSLSDSIRLSFVDGVGAVFVLNAPAGRTDTLRGRVFEFWDAGPPHETTHGPAFAVREACLP